MKLGSNLLVEDMPSAQYTVMKHVRAPMTDGQFAALTDFVFNVGSTNSSKSTLLKVVNESQDDQVGVQFRRWVLADGKTWPVSYSVASERLVCISADLSHGLCRHQKRRHRLMYGSENK